MRWLSRQPVTAHVLADPGHAWKYGTSVRVSATRDVFLEDVKDSAIAIYSRDVAQRVVERAAALGDFTTLTPERARALATTYDLDYLVTEARLDLPVGVRKRPVPDLRAERRSGRVRSFVPQRLHRADPRRAASRHVAGHEPDDRKDRGSTGEHQRVRWRHAKARHPTAASRRRHPSAIRLPIR